MAELSLREQIAHELWYKNTRSKYQWEYLISTRKKAWYTKADSIIKLMLAKVDKALLTDTEIRAQHKLYEEMFQDGFYKWLAKAQLQAIKDRLEGK